jgi:hypothetical protein
MRKFREMENHLKPYYLAHQPTSQNLLALPLPELMPIAHFLSERAISVRRNTSSK